MLGATTQAATGDYLFISEGENYRVLVKNADINFGFGFQFSSYDKKGEGGDRAWCQRGSLVRSPSYTSCTVYTSVIMV